MESSAQPAGAASDTEKKPGAQAPSPASSGRGNTKRRASDAWPWLVAAFALVVCLLPIGRAGLWDPQEVETADLARRAAIHLWGAQELSLDGVQEEVPTAEDVGRGELPLLSVALGLKLFGASAWAARLPLALWTLAGALALYLVVRRLENRRTALFAIVVLVTCPMVFTQARTVLGDAVTLAALCFAFTGWMLAWADDDAALVKRLCFVALGVAGMAAGAWSRGLLLGVAVPGLGVGLSWAVVNVREKDAGVGLRRALGATCLALGVGAAVWGSIALYRASPEVYSRVVGSTILDPKQMPTHDVVVHYVGHGLFPWSALLPLTLGALLRPCTDRRRALRIGLVLTIAVGLLFYTLTIARTGPIAFGGVFALAAACAIAALSFERAERGTFTAMVTAALLVLLYKDFENYPDKGMSAFVLSTDVAFPEALKGLAKRYLQAVTALGILACVAIVLSRAPWGEFVTRWSSASSRLLRAAGKGLNSVIYGWRKVTAPFAAAIPWPRAIVVVAAFGGGGTVLSLGYYPALAAQLSPAGVYTAYKQLADTGEPLAVMGDGAVKGSMFYAGSSVRSFRSVESAVDWLVDDAAARKWLILKAADLGRANSHYREQHPGENLPILDAQSSEILLAASALRQGENNENPLGDQVLSQAPAMRHAPVGRWGEELELIGWEIREAKSGNPTDTLHSGTTYRFVTAYRVNKRVLSTWESFIHIDGNGKRINGDHQLLHGKYPPRLWLPGDVIVDTHEFKLDPTYDAGEYTVYFGLFSGSKRYKMTAGEQKDDRLTAGVVHVSR